MFEILFIEPNLAERKRISSEKKPSFDELQIMLDETFTKEEQKHAYIEIRRVIKKPLVTEDMFYDLLLHGEMVLADYKKYIPNRITASILDRTESIHTIDKDGEWTEKWIEEL